MNNVRVNIPTPSISSVSLSVHIDSIICKILHLTCLQDTLPPCQKSCTLFLQQKQVNISAMLHLSKPFKCVITIHTQYWKISNSLVQNELYFIEITVSWYKLKLALAARVCRHKTQGVLCFTFYCTFCCWKKIMLTKNLASLAFVCLLFPREAFSFIFSSTLLLLIQLLWIGFIVVDWQKI